MSEQPSPAQRPASRERITARLQSLNFTREQRVVGPAEVVGLAGSALIFLLVVISYLYFLMPAKARLNALQAERSLLQSRVRSSQEEVHLGESTEAAAQRITQSLEEFESKNLPAASRGRLSLYDSLSSLIHKNGLRNTSGPTYTALEAAGSKEGAEGTRSANTKWQSVYPGLAISLTVEGQYPSLRRFIQDLEANKQFVIINSVELERATESNSSPVAEAAPAGGTAAALVSLRLEMTTYFQRDSIQNAVTNSVEP